MKYTCALKKSRKLTITEIKAIETLLRDNVSIANTAKLVYSSASTVSKIYMKVFLAKKKVYAFSQLPTKKPHYDTEEEILRDINIDYNYSMPELGKDGTELSKQIT